MGVSSNTHASSTSATTTPEAISQIKKQNMSNTWTKRMEWWKHGKLEELISEWSHSKKTQKISQNQKTIRPEIRLMLQGLVKKALKIVNHASDIDGKHDITTDIKKKLKEKHPKAAELK